MSQHSSPPNKRQRVDDADDLGGTSEPVTTRSPSLWFDDGNVVIQAEATRFRVYRSILSLHSDILADCFGLPQPEGEPTVDGCPLVHLSDTANEIQDVYGNYSVYDHTKPLPFPAVRAMIRLGRKYNFTAFQEEALRRLQKEFPQELNQWNEKDKYVFTFLEDSPSLLFELVNFAYENSIQSILPTAMTWLCLRYPLATIISGSKISDEKTISLLPGALEMCLIGRYGLCDVIPGYVDQLVAAYADFIDHCHDIRECAESFRMFLSEVFGAHAGVKGRVGSFQWQDVVEDDVVNSLCTSCGPKLTDKYEELRINAWENVPGYFGFQTWSALKDL
ncbi:unnamed protein product [Cyclocybe aegerita]|uniref:BTB domain-containing protein n=1 Tax=Cyclocybe aegerita TaxID=1973307 RepID=A0A8S0VXD8_CYCAE|nr:unnamed protein product [Cyclocybe aegerita]